MSLFIPIDYLGGSYPSLGEGQWQLGEVKFGRGTPITVANVDIGAYEHKLSDIQISQTDELRMGRDFFTPGVLTFDMGILNNRLLPSMAAITRNGGVGYPERYEIQGAQPLMEKLVATWRNDATRKRFGYLNYLRYCKFGMQKRIYGRPRKITTNIFNSANEYVPILAEFQRVDTLSYDDSESYVTGAPAAYGTYPIQAQRVGGKTATWVRYLIQGPINHPKINVKDQYEIELNYNVPVGVVVEITSYPWERRVITSLGQNISPLMIGNSPYMEKIVLQPSSISEIGLSGSATTADTGLVVLWREAYATL